MGSPLSCLDGCSPPPSAGSPVPAGSKLSLGESEQAGATQELLLVAAGATYVLAFVRCANLDAASDKMENSAVRRGRLRRPVPRLRMLQLWTGCVWLSVCLPLTRPADMLPTFLQR